MKYFIKLVNFTNLVLWFLIPSLCQLLYKNIDNLIDILNFFDVDFENLIDN